MKKNKPQYKTTHIRKKTTCHNKDIKKKPAAI